MYIFKKRLLTFSIYSISIHTISFVSFSLILAKVNKCDSEVKSDCEENVLLVPFVFNACLSRSLIFDSRCKHIELIKENEKRISDETCEEAYAPEGVHGKHSIQYKRKSHKKLT